MANLSKFNSKGKSVKPLIVAAMILLGCVLSVRAQEPGERYIVSSGIYSGFGYALGPSVGFETRQEIGRFETDADIDLTLAPKRQSITSQTVDAAVDEIVWVNDDFGVFGSLEYSELWAHGTNSAGNFTKSDFVPEVGIAFTDNLFHALWEIGYNQEIGPKINAKTGDENSDLKGIEILTEKNLFKAWGVTNALRATFDIDHGYNQGDPACDGTYGPVVAGCQRSQYIAVGVGVQYLFKF